MGRRRRGLVYVRLFCYLLSKVELSEIIIPLRASLLPQHHEHISLRAVVEQTAGVRFMAPAPISSRMLLADYWECFFSRNFVFT